jgi:hypothetical protein
MFDEDGDITGRRSPVSGARGLFARVVYMHMQAVLQLEDSQERQAAAAVSQVAMVVDTYNTAQRPKSLMELHQEKSGAKPKKPKKEGKEGKREGKSKKEKAASPPPKQKEDWEGVHPWKVRLPCGSKHDVCTR